LAPLLLAEKVIGVAGDQVVLPVPQNLPSDSIWWPVGKIAGIIEQQKAPGHENLIAGLEVRLSRLIRMITVNERKADRAAQLHISIEDVGDCLAVTPGVEEFDREQLHGVGKGTMAEKLAVSNE